MRTAIIIGTRPEIIKVAPLIKELRKSERIIIFTGQHYDFELGLRFFQELELPVPDYSLKIQKGEPAVQISQIISKLVPILSKTKPDTVMVQGDTNTAMAGAICSLKLNIPINHVEAGLRSYDWRMPEEHNRVTIDHISELLFTPTNDSRKNLVKENVHGKIFVTGNTVMDSISQYSRLVDKKSNLSIDFEDFILFTMHRAENVDNPLVLRNVISALIESSHNIIFPIHPRTQKRIREFNLHSKLANANNIKIIDSAGYFDILKLMKKCDFIISDSGGIQEEATSPLIRKKVLVIRKTTDRPESVKSGFATLVDLSKNQIKDAIKKISKNPEIKTQKSPYGVGNSSKIIASILRKEL